MLSNIVEKLSVGGKSESPAWNFDRVANLGGPKFTGEMDLFWVGIIL